MKKFIGLMGFLCFTGSVQADALYRSTDKTGKVHYGDKPLSDAAEVATLRPIGEPSTDESLPFELRRAKEKYPVTLYIADECAEACKLARGYLLKRGVPYAEKKLVTVDDVAAFKKASASEQLPTALIGKTWLKGFLESRWASELDVAGYPKTAPYGVRPAIKSAPENKNRQ